MITGHGGCDYGRVVGGRPELLRTLVSVRLGCVRRRAAGVPGVAYFGVVMDSFFFYGFWFLVFLLLFPVALQMLFMLWIVVLIWLEEK